MYLNFMQINFFISKSQIVLQYEYIFIYNSSHTQRVIFLLLILIPCGFGKLKIHHEITHRTVDVTTIALHEGIVWSIYKIDRQMTVSVLTDVGCG